MARVAGLHITCSNVGCALIVRRLRPVITTSPCDTAASAYTVRIQNNLDCHRVVLVGPLWIHQPTMRLRALYVVAGGAIYDGLRRLLGMRHKITIGDVIASRRKDRQRIYALPHDATAHDALKMMLAERITAVVVTRNLSPVGLLTQMDFLQRVALPELTGRSTPLETVMTSFSSPKLAYVFPGNSVTSSKELMAFTNCHHLPVFTEAPPTGTLLAVVSLDELVGLNKTLRESRALAWAAAQPTPVDVTKHATLVPATKQSELV